jgi:cell division protein ZapA
MNKITVNIDILGKSYQIKCPEQEVESLKKAALMLEEKMQVTRESAHLLSHDRMAVITSLNLAHQILLLEQQTQQYMQSVQERLLDLQGKVESALAQNSQMELASAE